MHTEYEVRILEIDVDDIIDKLEKLRAKKVGNWNYRRYVYDVKPKEEGKWIRLRTNGESTTLTYKNIVYKTVSGTKEVEIKVDDFDNTHKFLECIGFDARSYQENKRIRYMLDDVEVDIDTWPMIPSYLELEGDSEEDIMKIVDKLELDSSKVTSLSPQDIYIEVYGIDIRDMDIIKFKKESI